MDEDDIRRIVRQEMYALFFGSASGDVSSAGEQDGTGRAGEQLPGVPLCQHYGFASNPPSATERLYAETQAGTVSIAERSTARPSLSSGHTEIYDESGNHVLLQKANGILVKTLNGDMSMEVPGGFYIMIGGSSEFIALATKTKARLDALQNAHDTHKHGGVTTGAGTSAVPDVLVGALASVASTIVKAT